MSQQCRRQISYFKVLLLTCTPAWGQSSAVLSSPSENEVKVHALYLYGVDLVNNGQLQSSEKVLQQAHRQACELNPDGVLAGATANQLGLAYEELGQQENSEFYYLKALRIFESSPKNALTVINNLADLYLGTRQFAKVERLNLQEWLSKPGTGKEGTRAIANLASLALARGRYEEAEALFVRALKEYEAAGSAIPEAITLSNLGTLSLSRNRPQEAVQQFARALVICREQSGSFPVYCIKTLIGLGLAEARTGQKREALRDLREAASLTEQWVGEKVEAADNLELCAIAFNEAGQKSDARHSRNRAAQIRRATGWIAPKSADIADLLVSSPRR